MLCVIGLGNPGDPYAATRHNIGRMVVECFGARQKVLFCQKSQAFEGVGTIGTQQVRLVLPQTWMNQSGVVVNDLLYRFEISHRDLIVVYDDLDLPFGVLRIKTRGGSGGHNGIRSIFEYLETDEFSRLKVGISHPPPGMDTARYVLSSFTSSEISSLDVVLSRAVEALEVLILHGPAKAMNQFNVQPKPEEGG